MVTFKSINKNPDGKLYVKGQCLSSDIKPTNNIANGSILRELDTGKKCVFNEQSRIWIEYGTGEDRNGKVKKKNTIINSTASRLFGDMNDGEVTSLLQAIKNNDVTVKVTVQTTLGVFEGDLIVHGDNVGHFNIIGTAWDDAGDNNGIKCICIPFWWPDTYGLGGGAPIMSGYLYLADGDWQIVPSESYEDARSMLTTLTITEYELAGEPEPEPAVNWEYYRIEGDLETLGSAEESKQLASVLERVAAQELPVIASIYAASSLMNGNFGLSYINSTGHAEFSGSFPLPLLARSQINTPVLFFATIDVNNTADEHYAEWNSDFSGVWIETHFEDIDRPVITAGYTPYEVICSQMGVSLSDVKTTIELFVKKEADENAG